MEILKMLLKAMMTNENERQEINHGGQRKGPDLMAKELKQTI